MDKISSLQNTDILSIHEAFQRAFENYFVPMEMSCEQFRERMLSEADFVVMSAGSKVIKTGAYIEDNDVPESCYGGNLLPPYFRTSSSSYSRWQNKPHTYQGLPEPHYFSR